MSGRKKTDNNECIRFIIDGETFALTDVDPTRTVLQFLREDLGRTGTKEGCAEGDCGACTVALVDLNEDESRLKVHAVNSCIQFLPTLDGRELITVESLSGRDETLHPVQQAMVDCHGSQCGFCTPGFVMSLFAQFKNSSKPTRREIDDALAGNLCRCTGYKPIIDAAQSMYELCSSKQDEWLRIPDSVHCKADAGEKRRVAALRDLNNGNSLSIAVDDRQFHAPTNVTEFAKLFAAEPDATILAGGTDVGLWVTKQHKQIKTVIYTGRVAGMTDISVEKEVIDIGAAATLSDVLPILDEHYPQLHDLFIRFASPPIRNAATLGGNIANGSPIGDSMPALLALDASVVLRKGTVNRTLPLHEFYLGYQENALASGEFVERIRMPRLDSEAILRSYKISKRFDQDISAVCGAFCLQLNGESIVDAKIAYGGVASIPKRADETEKSLRGAQWSAATARSAMESLAKDFQPISDMRSSAGYRLKVCQNLLYRFWLETSDPGVATDVYNYGR